MDQIVNFPRYESYRDSGTDWLGQVPSDWSLESIRAVTLLKSEKNKPDLQVLSVYREYGVILKDSRDDNHNATSLDTSGYKVVNEGDLVVNKMKAWQGSMGVSEHNGIVSPAYITCRVDAKRVHPKFLHYLLRSQPYISIYNALSYGVRVGQWDMHYEDFKRIPLPLPARNCQQLIANFLDQKTAEIDVAIAKKQRLIELLKEQKAILINQAVTKGLNPDVPMRDSGVEWIGDVPEHWVVRRSKYVFAQRKELARKDDVQLSATQAYGVIPQDEYESRIGRRVVKIQFHLEKRKHVELDDFVISMRSFQGGLERAWSAGCIRSSYIVLRPLVEISADYYGYLLKSARYIDALQATANFIRDGQDLNFNNFSMVDLLIVPLDEQRQIATYLDEQLSLNGKAKESLHQQIEKLKEYKAALISSVVTGKIKVA